MDFLATSEGINKGRSMKKILVLIAITVWSVPVFAEIETYSKLFKTCNGIGDFNYAKETLQVVYEAGQEALCDNDKKFHPAAISTFHDFNGSFCAEIEIELLYTCL